jgi:CRISPR-associated exonuclease Cas4
VHARVDAPGFEVRTGVRVERSLPIWNDRLGLIGKADVVEFLADDTPYPVEYKHGSRRKSARIAACDDLQVAAQALCLEEMTEQPIREGAIYYATSKRRRVVTIDNALRAAVEAAVDQVRAMIEDGFVPPPANDERCRECSLFDLCQPGPVADRASTHVALSHLFDPES